ncbi:class I SAM-dependent methyltransferase [Bacillus salitolerans]|uniref:Class I SAM-dependent methyltransferase n=1 Tax=Bacillus salitolerans TaxID=1437434 RepID=A0ABW4LKR9_9BACI
MNIEKVETSLIQFVSALESLHVPYQFIDESALIFQGVQLSQLNEVRVSVQWDLMETLYENVKDYDSTPLRKAKMKASFSLTYDGIPIHIECHYNTTVRTDPYRIAIHKAEKEIWVQSIYAYLYKGRYIDEITYYLGQLQQALTSRNKEAWNQDQYEALVERYGRQREMAAKIKENPAWRLHPFYSHLGDVNGKRIVHLLGSNGIKGVALAVLGADVKIVDFSKENAEYARVLAKEAEVTLEYIESDVFSLPPDRMESESTDIVLMELGVLHYFVSLHPLARVIKNLLKIGGKFVLHEFHPISTKLITSTGKKHKVTGNYFNPEIEEHQVAFSKHLKENDQGNLTTVLQRKWTIGEVITAFAQEGLVIKSLEEEPNHKIHDMGLPKTFTLITEKI